MRVYGPGAARLVAISIAVLGPVLASCGNDSCAEGHRDGAATGDL